MNKRMDGCLDELNWIEAKKKKFSVNIYSVCLFDKGGIDKGWFFREIKEWIESHPSYSSDDDDDDGFCLDE